MFNSPFLSCEYIVGVIENGLAKAQDFAKYIGYQNVIVVEDGETLLPFLHYGGVLPEVDPEGFMPHRFGGIFYFEIADVNLVENTVKIIVGGEKVVMDMDADELAIRIEAT